MKSVEVIVYFVDPKDLWVWQMEKVAVIYQAVIRFPWLWLAHAIAKSNQGNTGNTGYLIRDFETGELIENVKPTRPWVTCL
jgi:hypothetical protein